MNKQQKPLTTKEKILLLSVMAFSIGILIYLMIEKIYPTLIL